MPIVRLTAANVRSLPPINGRRADYRDDILRGLVLRVSHTGARSFVLAYSRRGKNKRYTLGPTPPITLAEAREEGRKILSDILLGKDPQDARAAARRNELTVARLVGLAIEAAKLKPSTRYQWEWLAKKELSPAPLGTTLAADLTRGQIREWAARVEKRSLSTADHAFRLLRRCYSWGVEVDRLAVTPFAHLPSPGKGKLRSSDRVLSPQEIRFLLQALDESPGQYADEVLLLLFTMVRLESGLGAQEPEMEDFDGDEPRWTVPPERMKSGLPFIVPLSSQAAAVFRRRMDAPRESACLFPPVGRVVAKCRVCGAVHMAWSSDWIAGIRKRMEKLNGATIPPWTIHNLRHTTATQMGDRLGVDRDLRRLLLGHAAPNTATAVYDRAERLPERRAALVSWGAWLDALRVTQEAARVLPHRRRTP